MSIAPPRIKIGPGDHGRRMSLDDFHAAEWTSGHLYELSRGVVDVTEVPGVPHGLIVDRLAEMFILYRVARPGVITYRAGGSECRIRLPWMASDRHPDQAIYLTPIPELANPWAEWVPAIVVEVLSRGGEERDFVLKREEYRAMGVGEYWMLDRFARAMAVDRRVGDRYEELVVGIDEVHRTDLLPGLEVSVRRLLGAED